MKYKFDFLLLEFKNIYYGINKIFNEENLEIVSSTLNKLIKEIIIIAHLNNNLFYNPDNDLKANIDILFNKKILPYDLKFRINNYVDELKLINTLVFQDLSEDEVEDYKNRIKNKRFIYEICVWLAIKAGEEDYSLFIDKLSDDEKIIFDKYIRLNNKGYSLDNEWESKEIELNEYELEDIELEDIEFEDIDLEYYKELDVEEEDSDKDEVSIEENLLAGEIYYLGKKVARDYKKAKECFEKAAKKGNSQAESYLGLFYEKGYGVEKNIDKALYWYEKAAEKGNVFSQYSLGFIYYEGKEVERNLYYSFKWYKKAAENDFAPAQYAVSYLYKKGDGCELNNLKSLYWLEEAADNDFQDAYYLLGQCYLEGDGIEINYKKAFFYLSKGAEKKDEKCLESIGDMYYWGLFVDKDKERAFYYYNESIKAGNNKIYYKLGSLYEDEGNVEVALKNYNKGHKEGDERATQRLGEMYLNGDGVVKEESRGLSYIKLAMNKNEPESLYTMGVALIKEDRGKALEYLKKSYIMGSYNAAAVLASEEIKNYINGIEINTEELLEYVNRVVENDLIIGNYYLGLLYCYGIGVEQNNEKSFINFSKAAEDGCAEAILMLASLYKYGIFVQQDINKAMILYGEEAKRENVNAILELIEIYEKGLGGKLDYKKAFEGALLLKKVNKIQGNIKLAYYYYKGIGVKASREEGDIYIKELLELDLGKAFNLIGELAEEGILKDEEIIENYKSAISLGEVKAYSNLEYYLYKRGERIEDYIDSIPEGAIRNPKSIYIKGIKTLNEGQKNNDKNLIDNAIIMLRKSIYLGFYEGINDLINYYKRDTSIEGKINLSRYKELKIYYNI